MEGKCVQSNFGLITMLANTSVSAAFWRAFHTSAPPQQPHVRPPQPPMLPFIPYDAKERKTLVEIKLLEKWFSHISGGQILEQFIDLRDKFLEENLQ